MIVRQVRLLLLVKELEDKKPTKRDVASSLQIHPFVAGKVLSQAKNFDDTTLKNIYKKLLSIDLSLKTGEKDTKTLMDLFILSWGYDLE